MGMGEEAEAETEARVGAEAEEIFQTPAASAESEGLMLRCRISGTLDSATA